MLETLRSLFDVPALWTVAPGAAMLGVAAGAVGCFALLRRQSLQGDVVSHAALPGVAIAFLLGGQSPAMLCWAARSGWVALVLVGVVGRRSRVPIDAALGGTLAVFFGLGLALMQRVQKMPGAVGNPLDRVLFGAAANLRESDLWVIGVTAAVALAVLVLAWKELKLLTFDPDYAASVGMPTRGLDLLLTTLTVIAVVIGLKAVGVVLMTARYRSRTRGSGRTGSNHGDSGRGVRGLRVAEPSSHHPFEAAVPTGLTTLIASDRLPLLLGTARTVWNVAKPPARS